MLLDRAFAISKGSTRYCRASADERWKGEVMGLGGVLRG